MVMRIGWKCGFSIQSGVQSGVQPIKYLDCTPKYRSAQMPCVVYCMALQVICRNERLQASL